MEKIKRLWSGILWGSSKEHFFMRLALLAGSISLSVNLIILSAFIPLAVGFQPVIILQIAFWTFFATTGATMTMFMLKKFAPHPGYSFILLAFLIFFLSLIPIYLRVGIFHNFPYSLADTVTKALVTMHIVDSLTISGFVIRLATIIAV